MIDDVEKYIDFLEEYDINSHQFLFCYLVALEDYRNIKRHFVDKKQILKSHEIDKLITNGIITIKNYNKTSGALNLRQVSITKSFMSKLVINKEEAATEIFEAYFDYGWWDNQKIPARDIVLEDFVEMYGKIIKNNKQEHERILKITKEYVKSREYAEKGLRKYIGTRMYNLLESNTKKVKETKRYGEDKL